MPLISAQGAERDGQATSSVTGYAMPRAAIGTDPTHHWRYCSWTKVWRYEPIITPGGWWPALAALNAQHGGGGGWGTQQQK